MFPFVYKYTNQYTPIKPCKADISFEESLKCYETDSNGMPVDPHIPKNSSEGGVCATNRYKR